ncbi:MAG: type I methionyl aminopeptidase [Sumerlaeia bacterium]
MTLKALQYPIKSKRQIELMRKAGHVLRSVMDEVIRRVDVGVSPLELDQFAEKMIRSRGGRPAFKGLYGFPNTLCVSINEEIVHGIPKNNPLQEGDIISIDCGVEMAGYYADMAWTAPVGKVSDEAKKLLETTEQSLYKAIDAAVVPNRLGAIGRAVEDYVVSRGGFLVQDYGGHGIGQELHEDPRVENFGPKPGSSNGRLRPGMTLAIEPMVAVGTGKNELDKYDEWTVRTADGSLAAHFEHTILITEGKAEVLTAIDQSKLSLND